VKVSPFAAVFSFHGNATPPRHHIRNGGLLFQVEKVRSLFRLSEFRSECQDFLHRSQLVRELRIQGHAFQLIPNPQPKQVITCDLWSGYTPPHFSSVLREGLFVGRPEHIR